MAVLILHRPDGDRRITFSPPARLDDILSAADVPLSHPCGGRGVCGKCRVRIEGGLSPMNAAEKKAGHRLSCQTVLTGDCEYWPETERESAQIESTSGEYAGPLHPERTGYGIAVDIGTTTVVVQLYNLSTGKRLSEASARNRQIGIAADVMGRIGAAMEGRLEDLRSQITGQIDELTLEACRRAGLDSSLVSTGVFTGNTTMLYLLTGRDPECLSHAPFSADTLFDTEFDFHGISVYLPPCFSAFVGADIACAILYSGMLNSDRTALLCDVGTNGEMALWKDGKLSVCSTAAGPAFEGAGITCGCSDVPGAIDSVRTEDGKPVVHTIRDLPAEGICGSGLIDAVAALLNIGELDETGYLEDDYVLSGKVYLTPSDIRAVQLAKAAIAGGMKTLLERSLTQPEDLSGLYLAGGFGNHLNPESAARIGLFPRVLSERTRPIGNAALGGAAAILLNRDLKDEVRRMQTVAGTVPLGGDPLFNRNYVDEMCFPED